MSQHFPDCLHLTGTLVRQASSSVRRDTSEARSAIHADVALLLGLSSYTNPAHIALATLEANAFQTRAILESMKLDSNSDLKHLMVDGGMTNGDLAMSVLADIGGFDVVRPEMRESVKIPRPFDTRLIFAA